MSSASNGSTSRWWPFGGRARVPAQGHADHRRLALQLHHDLARGQEPRSVLVASPRTSGLAARTTAALARCMAEELGDAVLLADASPWRPDLTRMLECMGRPGLTDLLDVPEPRIRDHVVATNHDNVFFLPAGTQPERFARAAPRDGARVFLEAATRDFDFVVLFARSVLDDSAALALAPAVGCVLLLAVDDDTSMDDLGAAQRALEACQPRKVGLVITTPVTGRRRGRTHDGSV